MTIDIDNPEVLSAAVDNISEGLGFSADTNEDLDKGEEGAAEGEGAARDAAGRFAAKQDEGEGQSAEEQSKAASPSPAPAAASATDPAAPTPAPVPGALQPPSSWTPEMQGKWSGLAPEYQAYIIQRENQMHEGAMRLRSAADFGRAMTEAITPFMPVMQAHGIDPTVHVRTLMNAHHTLALGSQAQKVDMIRRLASDYGISLNQVVDPSAPGIPHEVLALQENVSRLSSTVEQQTRARQEEIRRTVEQTIETFKSNPAHPYFDEVEDEIAVFVRNGVPLATAYEKAVWANPVTRAKEQSRLDTERTAKAQAEAKAAADAKAAHARQAKAATGANVKSAARSGVVTDPLGSMDDTLKETLKAIQARV